LSLARVPDHDFREAIDLTRIATNVNLVLPLAIAKQEDARRDMVK